MRESAAPIPSSDARRGPVGAKADNGRRDPSMYKLALSTSLVCPQTAEAVREIMVGGLLREVGSQHPSAPALVEVDIEGTTGRRCRRDPEKGTNKGAPRGTPLLLWMNRKRLRRTTNARSCGRCPSPKHSPRCRCLQALWKPRQPSWQRRE